MIVQFYKRNLKKKKLFNCLVLYCVFLQYKILFFVHINILKKNINFNVINYKVRFLKINSSYIISLLNKNINNKNYFNIFKKNIIVIFSNNFLFLENISDTLLFSNLIMVCLNYYFINVKYLFSINIIYKLFNANYKLYNIFIYNLFFIIKYYVYFIIKNMLYINKSKIIVA